MHFDSQLLKAASKPSKNDRKWGKKSKTKETDIPLNLYIVDFGERKNAQERCKSFDTVFINPHIYSTVNPAFPSMCHAYVASIVLATVFSMAWNATLSQINIIPMTIPLVTCIFWYTMYPLT